MNKELMDACYKLKDALENSKAYINLAEAEEELEKSDEAKILSYRMDQASIQYNDALKIYSLDSKEAHEKQALLYEAKKKLDELEVCKKYNHAYKEVKLLLNEINKIIFDDLKYVGCKVL